MTNAPAGVAGGRWPVAGGLGMVPGMTGVPVIEDDDRIRLALLLALEEEGYDVIGAATAEEGLRAQRRDPADSVNWRSGRR